MNLLGFITRPKEDVFPQTPARDGDRKEKAAHPKAAASDWPVKAETAE